MELLRRLANDAVEVFCGIALVVGGIVMQVAGSPAGESPDRTLMITGAVLVAFGGVLLSWITSKALAEGQADEAVATARSEIDQKLDNLSRVLGQSAGQISQAVEQAELDQIPAPTGFALVSQATRMIYGQVNEIAVIRGAAFDSAYLLQTANQLDDLARQLGAPGTAAHAGDIAEVRRQLELVQERLSASGHATQRTYANSEVPCPYCQTANVVRLGTTPGETAAAVCAACGETFNSHRASNGAAFSRPRGSFAGASAQPHSAVVAQPVEKWIFACPECSNEMRTPTGGPERTMVCTSCFKALSVNAQEEEVDVVGSFRVIENAPHQRNGNRPKFECPDCGRAVKAALRTDRGYLGLCTSDRVAMLLDVDLYDTQAGVSATLNGASMGGATAPSGSS